MFMPAQARSAWFTCGLVPARSLLTALGGDLAQSLGEVAGEEGDQHMLVHDLMQACASAGPVVSVT